MASFADSLFGRMGTGRQVAIIAVGVIVTALVYGVSTWAVKPTMVPLYADVPVDQVKRMTVKLDELGIKYELDQGAGTTIKVSSEDLVRARVDMAAEAMPGDGRPGLEIFDKQQWGNTDFTQKVNYRRALEGELERSIGKLKNVRAVQVHLALEEDQLFKANERKSKASVTIDMANGEVPKPDLVDGITRTVAGSVSGLTPDQVTVVDSRGQALTMQEDGSLAGLTSRQLAVQREVESYMEQKANKLLLSLVGNGNASVQVSAAINFDKIDRTTQAVDPDKQATATEQKAEVSPSSPQQGAGYTSTATSYENTKSVETFSGAIGNVKRLTVAVLVADKVAPRSPSDTGAKAAATPPVITARTPEELTRIETLVRNAIGVDSTRGDMISVVSAPFDIPTPMVVKADSVVKPDLMTRVQSNPKPIVAIASLVVLLVVGVLTLNALKPKKSAQQAENAARALPAGTHSHYPELPASSQMQAAMMQSGDGMDQMSLEERRQVVLPPPMTTPEREQAMATVDQRPDAALRVTRNWLRS